MPLNKFVGFAILALVSCTKFGYQNRPFIPKTVAYDSLQVKDSKEPTPQFYYVVPRSELKRLNPTSGIKYLGTENGYHLLQIWEKIAADKNEAWAFALHKDSCNVENPRSQDEEFKTHSASYRRVDFENGCDIKDKH
jgi:hypothetical protein